VVSVSSAQWLTEDEQRTWRRLAALTMLLPAAIESQLQRDADLTHFGYWVMAMLSEAPDHALRMTELATSSNGSQSRLSHLVARLEQRGWVRRERAGVDGRGYLAVLTEAGRAKLVAVAPGHVGEVRSRIFDKLTPAQIGQLGDICESLLDGLGDTGGGPGDTGGGPAGSCPGECPGGEP
jgi:DNA-binding MarR family transcriptional regulator